METGKSWEGWRHKYVPDEEFEYKRVEEFHRKRANAPAELEHLQTNYKYYVDNGNEYYKKYFSTYANMTLEEYYAHVGIDKLETFSFNIPGSNSNPKLIPREFENVPLEGFVLNKKAGDYKSGWNHRQAYCRVYDPRNFEIEITIENLLYILDYANSIKGKGLEGKFVYGWNDKQLVLLPEECPEFADIVKYNEHLKQSITKEDLVVGGIYQTAKYDRYVYIGHQPVYDDNGVRTGNGHWFLPENTTSVMYYYNYVHKLSDFKSYTGDVVDDIEKYTDMLLKDKRYAPSKVTTYEYVKYDLDTLNEHVNKFEGYSYRLESLEVYIKENKTFKKKYVLVSISRPYSYYASRVTKEIKSFQMSTRAYESGAYGDKYTYGVDLLKENELYFKRPI